MSWRLGLIGVGLLGAAVNTGNNLIYLLFSLLAAGYLLSAVAARANLSRLRGELRLPAAPRVGAPFAVELSIVNPRRRFAARALDLTLITDQGDLGPVFVERVAPGSTVRIEVPARGRRRGPQKIRGVRLRSCFPLGLLTKRRVHPLDAEILVLPAFDDSAALAARPGPESGSADLSPRVSGIEYLGLRRGRGEDDLRKVDWKVTARRGVVVVRETAGHARRELRIDLDTRAEGASRELEAAISRVAGLARRALRDGGTVRLSVDGRAQRTYSGPVGLQQVLRRLARVSPLPPCPARPDSPTERRPVEPHDTAPGRAHRQSTLAAMLISASALFFFQGIGPLGFAALLGSLAATSMSTRFVARRDSWAGRLWQAAGFGALIVFLTDVIAVRRDLLAASMNLLVFISLYVLFHARAAEHHRRILLVSFLHMVLAAALTTEVAFALPLVAWLTVTVHALIAWTAIPGADGTPRLRVRLDPPAGRWRYASPALAGATALLGAGLLVFALVPHLGTGTFRPTSLRAPSISGFSESARLGDIGRIKLDGSRVMEVKLDRGVQDAGLKWGGLALSVFDGRGWTRGAPYKRRVAVDAEGRLRPAGGWATPPGAGDRRPLTQRIRLEPTGSTVLFAAHRPRLVTSHDFRRIAEDRFGNLELYARPGRRLSYTVSSDAPPRDLERLRAAQGPDPPAIARTDLALPALDARIPALARRITSTTSTRYDAASAIESWLATRLRYSLAVDDRGSADPLASFLFDGMAGHCEYFASAMVVLARSAGIPARYVTGYLRGEKSRFGNRYVVRQSDAHAWVEVFLPGVGWVSFDPTPPVGRTVREAPGLTDLVSYLYSSMTRLWDDYVIGTDLDDQARGVLAVLSSLGAAAAAAGRALARFPLRSAALVVGLALALVTALWAGRRRARRLRPPGALPDGVASRRPVPRFYRRLLEFLSKRDLVRRTGETPAELAARAGAVLGARDGERVRELTRLYYRARFRNSGTDQFSRGQV